MCSTVEYPYIVAGYTELLLCPDGPFMAFCLVMNFVAISKHKEEDSRLIEAFNRGVRAGRAINAVPLDAFSVVVDKLLWNEEDLPLIPPCEPWDEAVLDSVPEENDLYCDELDPAMTVHASDSSNASDGEWGIGC
jgi:hypothetical protein